MTAAAIFGRRYNARPAGEPCPRCNGQLFAVYRGEDPFCLQCGYERPPASLARLDLDGLDNPSKRRVSMELAR